MNSVQDKIMMTQPAPMKKNETKMYKKMGTTNREIRRLGISNQKIRRRMG